MLPALYPFETESRWIEVSQDYFDQDSLPVVRNLLNKGLIPLVHGTEIALFLGISPRLLTHIVNSPGAYYRTFSIPKRSGESREITAPRVFLKTIQRYILDCILSQVPVHAAVCGFQRGLYCGSGAQCHVGRSFLWNIDLKDFFPSIPKKRVTAAFEGMGYPFVAAYFLAGLCCLRGSLPQGAPTSPALSNIIFNKVDIALSELVDGKNIIYTRYADDLSFSGMKPIPVSFQRQVIRLLKTNGYFVQLKKSRLMGPAMRREVTGLTINEKVSLPRVRRRKLRAYFHDISLNPAAHSKKRTEALGFASWVKNHHPSEGRYYMEIALGIPLEPVSGDTA